MKQTFLSLLLALLPLAASADAVEIDGIYCVIRPIPVHFPRDLQGSGKV